MNRPPDLITFAERSDPRIVRAVAAVDIAAIEQLLAGGGADLQRIFAEEELQDAGNGRGRAAHLAARAAAKQACVQLFPQEAAQRRVTPADFVITRDGYGAPRVDGGATLQALLDRYRLRGVAVSLAHDHARASAVAIAEPAEIDVPLVGKLAYHVFPIRRRVLLANLRRAFGGRIPEREIVRLAQAHYAYWARQTVEFFRFPWLSIEEQAARVRVENMEVMWRAATRAKGVLLLTAHFGDWAAVPRAALAKFPEYRGRFHAIVRDFWPRWLYRRIVKRFREAGLGVLKKKGSLDAILDRLAMGEVVMFALDQHAAGREGVGAEFFGEEAWVLRSLATVAQVTGAPVVPAACWHEPDGGHLLRFEEEVPVVHCDDPADSIRANTRAYMAALERLILRHPEQWAMWMHRMWKGAPWEVAPSLTRRLAQRLAKVRG